MRGSDAAIGDIPMLFILTPEILLGLAGGLIHRGHDNDTEHYGHKTDEQGQLHEAARFHEISLR